MNRQRFSFQQIIGYALVSMVFIMTSCGSSSVSTLTPTPTNPTPSPTSNPCPSLAPHSNPTSLNLGMNETITGFGRIHGLDICSNGPPGDHDDYGDILVPPDHSLGRALEIFITEHTILKIPIALLKPNEIIGFAATAETNGILDFTEIDPPPLPNTPDIVTYQGQLVEVDSNNVLKFTVNPLKPQLSFQFAITDNAVLKSAKAIPRGDFITVRVQFFDSTGYKVLSVTKQATL